MKKNRVKDSISENKKNESINKTFSLVNLIGLSRYRGKISKSQRNNDFDRLGLEGKDCPCAPR